MAEFHVHGSMAMVINMQFIKLMLEDTKKCRIAEPGEFTKKKIVFMDFKMEK